MKLRLRLLVLLVTSIMFTSTYAQKKDVPVKDSLTKSTKILSIEDLDLFFNSLQSTVKATDGSELKLSVKEYQMITDLFNQILQPIIQKWKADHSK